MSLSWGCSVSHSHSLLSIPCHIAVHPALSLCAHSLPQFPPQSQFLSWLSLRLHFLLSCLCSSVDRCVPIFLAPSTLLIISCSICMSGPYLSPLPHHSIAPCMVSCLILSPLLPFLSLTFPALLLFSPILTNPAHNQGAGLHCTRAYSPHLAWAEVNASHDFKSQLCPDFQHCLPVISECCSFVTVFG